MSPLPHTYYLFYKENCERLLSFDYILFNGFVHFFLFSFAFLFLQMIFLFKEPYLWPCLYSSCSHSSLTRVLSLLKWRRDRIYSSSTQLNWGVFCGLAVAVKWKNKFQKHWLMRTLLFMLCFSNAGRFLLDTHAAIVWPSCSAQSLPPIACRGVLRS